MVANDAGPTVTVNGVRRPLGSAVLWDLVSQEGHDPARAGIAVAVNGEVIPRASWASHRLGPGDAIEIVGAVQGG